MYSTNWLSLTKKNIHNEMTFVMGDECTQKIGVLNKLPFAVEYKYIHNEMPFAVGDGYTQQDAFRYWRWIYSARCLSLLEMDILSEMLFAVGDGYTQQDAFRC